MILSMAKKETGNIAYIEVKVNPIQLYEFFSFQFSKMSSVE